MKSEGAVVRSYVYEYWRFIKRLYVRGAIYRSFATVIVAGTVNDGDGNVRENRRRRRPRRSGEPRNPRGGSIIARAKRSHHRKSRLVRGVLRRYIGRIKEKW